MPPESPPVYKLDVDAPLFVALSAAPPTWWRNLLADPELWVDVRKGNRINVYYRGGSVVDLSYARGYNARIHFEYVPVQESSTHVKLVFGDDGDTAAIDDDAVQIAPLDSFRHDVLNRIKKRIRQFNPPGSEKSIQAEFVLANPAFLDTEFQYGSARVDLVWLDLPSRRIVFVELKTIGDSRLYLGQDTQADGGGIDDQLRRYNEFLTQQADELAHYYRRLFSTKKRLGLLRGLDLDNIDDFTVETRPVLLVGDCSRKWIDDNSTALNARIAPFALGAFYHGTTTRKFRVPTQTTGNKYVFGATNVTPVRVTPRHLGCDVKGEVPAEPNTVGDSFRG